MSFADLKAQITSPHKVNKQGHRVLIPQIADGNTSTCASFTTGESLAMVLDKPGSIYAARLFLRRGLFLLIFSSINSPNPNSK